MDKEINPATGYPDTGHFGGAPPQPDPKPEKEKPEKEKPIE